MKKYFSLALSVFLLTATANTAQAFDKKDLAKLKKTQNCIKCALSKADLMDARLTGANLTKAYLSGATWTDGIKCGKGSIGKCVRDTSTPE
jgi:hypothetical protein